MTKKTSVDGEQPSAATAPTVRDAKTGWVLPLRDYGALKGQYAVRRGIDLTKPISEQVAKLERAGEPDRTPAEQVVPSGGERCPARHVRAHPVPGR